MLKKYVLLPLLSFISLTVFTQSPTTMYVQGATLYDKCGNEITLHGVNYPVLDDWAFPASVEVSSEIAQSGANAVRIQWYIDYGQPGRPAYALKDLDTVISRIARLDMIPIVELHDYTCQTGMSELGAEIVPWFTQNEVLNLIDKHKAYLIINLANEYGYVNWAGNVNAAQTQFQTAYANAVIALRNAGINVPIMIDAPDCGTSSNRLVDVAAGIHSADPLGNVLFSVHAYWYGYAQNDSLTMRNYIQQMAGSGYCFLLGEVANYQDDGSYCTYSLDYTAILHSATDSKIGWLVWAWYKDGCAARQVTSTGNFTNLTAYGNDVIHNSTYGLMHIAERSPYLLYDNCTMGIAAYMDTPIRVFPNPASNYIKIENEHAGYARYALLDLSGRNVLSMVSSNAVCQFDVSELAAGYYTLLRNEKAVAKVLIGK